jgi:hypothetical protein
MTNIKNNLLQKKEFYYYKVTLKFFTIYYIVKQILF